MLPVWMTFSDLFKVMIIQRQITWKWYNIQLYLQWPTNRKSYVIYWRTHFSMTLNDRYPQFLDYTCPVWYPDLTKQLTNDIECVQMLFRKLLFPAVSYTESLRKSGLERLDDRCDMITQSLFRQIKDPKHPLHYFLLKCFIVLWFCGLHMISISNSTGQNFTLWKGLCTILHCQ